MVSINHGIPKHDCFMVFQPDNEDIRRRLFNVKLKDNFNPELVNLVDPLTSKTHVGTPIDFIKYHVDEIPDMFCFMAYGNSAIEVAKRLKHRYPQLTINPTIEIWLLKKQSI